jgi:hypothetical protein
MGFILPELIEDELVEILGRSVEPLATVAFPEDPEMYVRELIDSASGAVIVSCAGAHRTSGPEHLPEFIYMPEITVLATSLRGRGGALPVIGTIITLLDDRRLMLTNQDEMPEPVILSVEEFGYNTRRHDLWDYTVRLSARPVLARR